jgi:biopolymer transport protein ExbD
VIKRVMQMKKQRRKGEAAKLEMTPMIDVVFQLLIFFLVTLKPEDILSKLEVSRPAPDPDQKKEEEVDLLTVVVYNEKRLGGKGVSLKGRQITFEELDRQFARLASFSKTISVIIKCTGDSPHANLVGVLDICAKNELKNLAVFSM